MSVTLTPAGGQPLQVVRTRLFVPWIGPWYLDLDVDLGTIPTLPSGKVVVTIGASNVLTGTVDPTMSAAMGEAKAHVRVVGGGNGWRNSVSRKPVQMDGGVFFAKVLMATATEVGEVATTANPAEQLDKAYIRMEGPASQILSGRQWHVNAMGVTIVGPRAPIVPVPGTLDILDWDGISHRLTAASDDIVWPGTVIVDPRIGQTVVRTVDQTWSDAGSQVHAWCSPDEPAESNPGYAAVAAMIDHRVQRPYCVPQLYRLVRQDVMGRCVLQAVSPHANAPDMIPLSVWGVSGISAMYTPGSEVLVSFINGDPNRPVITNWKDGTPIELQLDAATFVTVGGPLAGPVVSAAAFMTILGLLKTAIAAAGPTGAAAVTALESALVPVLPLVPTKKLRSE